MTSHQARMRRDHIARAINPPRIGEPSVVLSPPIGSVDAYMKYLADHREDYARLFGSDCIRGSYDD